MVSFCLSSMKNPMIFAISIFTSLQIFKLSRVEHEKSITTSGPGVKHPDTYFDVGFFF